MHSRGRYVSIGLLSFAAAIGCDSSEVADSPDSSTTPVPDAAAADAAVKHDGAVQHDSGHSEDSGSTGDAAKEPEAGLDGGPNHSALCPATAQSRATTAIKELHDHWFVSGNWTSCLAWHQSNLLETVVDFADYAHATTYDTDIDQFFNTENVGALLNSNSFDDTQWVALAWMRADDVSPQARYTQRAKQFYEYAAQAWDDTKCGGGMWWSGARDYKNAITNELFIMSSMRMYEKTQASLYLENAKKAWAWFDQSGMINANGLVNDGLVTATCKNNGQTTWIYNQGVILGGLAKLSTATGDASLIDRGAQIIDAVLKSPLVTSEGILQESCELGQPGCNQDQMLFKGIFVRYLGYFLAEAHRPDLLAKYLPFVATNAAAIWNRSRSGNTFDLRWVGPFSKADPVAQGSASAGLLTALQYADPSFCP